MSAASDLERIGWIRVPPVPDEWESLPTYLSSWHELLRAGLPPKNIRVARLTFTCLFKSPLWPEASLREWILAANALHTYAPLAGESLFAQTEAVIRYAVEHPEVVRGLLALERLK